MKATATVSTRATVIVQGTRLGEAAKRHGPKAKYNPDEERQPAMTGTTRGINPDGTPDESMLEEITAAIVTAVQPQQIILFGSAARGQMNEKSDLDVLVIKDGEHYRKVTRKIHMSLPARTRRVDLIVASSRDIQRHRHKPYYVIEPALREGRVLYEQAAQP